MMDKKVGQDLSDHGNGNGSSSTRCSKFISFFVNNRSNHFEQLRTKIKVIQKVSNSKINKINKNINGDLSDHDNGNSSINTRYPKFNSF